MATSKKAKFAGIEFSGTDMGEFGVRVSKPTFLKILNSGRIVATCTSNHDDTGQDENIGEVDPSEIGIIVNQTPDPNVLRLDTRGDKPEIVYSPHRNQRFVIVEKEVEEEYTVKLTAKQIRLIRKVIGEKAQFVKSHPLPEDGDLFKQLCDADKPLHFIEQCIT
jgi:hypothetical protein